MNKIVEWFEDRQKRSFHKYESWYFAFYELNKVKEKTFAEKFLCYYAALYLSQFEIKRSLLCLARREISDRWARKELKKFYQTHNPPYSKEEKCEVVALQMSSRQGRKMLADSMLEPLRMENATV